VDWQLFAVILAFCLMMKQFKNTGLLDPEDEGTTAL